MFLSVRRNFPLTPFSCVGSSQVKSDIIRQREVELLVPAAGPDASEVFHLLRPATPKSAKSQPPTQAAEDGGEYAIESPLPDKLAEHLTPAKQRQKLMASLACLPTEKSMAAATVAAVAASGFGGGGGQATAVLSEQQRQAAPQVGPRTTETSIVAEHLIGLSCAICERGKVIFLSSTHDFSRDLFSCQHRPF